MAKEKNEVAVRYKGGALADFTCFDSLALQALKENLGNERISAFDLERIKVPGAGAEFWSVQDISGEVIPMKTLRGILIFQKPQRAFWQSEYTGEAVPPDCHSEDTLIGIGNPGGICVTCPYSQWESDPRGNGGQACKMINTLFFMRPGNVLPDLIIAPPTSVQPIKKYLMALAKKQTPYYAALTVLGLKITKSKGGIAYAIIAPAFEAPLLPEDVKKIMAFRDSMSGTFAAASQNLGQEDVAQEDVAAEE